MIHWLVTPESDPRSYLPLVQRGRLHPGHRGLDAAKCPLCSAPPKPVAPLGPPKAPKVKVNKPRLCKPVKQLERWEVILIAASNVSLDCNGLVPATELILACWRLAPAFFGLNGRVKDYPDSFGVISLLTSLSGPVNSGILREKEANVWTIAPKGWQHIHELRKYETKVDECGQKSSSQSSS